MNAFIVNFLIVIGAIVATEVFAIWLHRYVMHGPGWFLHRSHHEPRTGYFEINDLYALVFAILATALFIVGGLYWSPLWYVGVGITIYGVLYSLVHDGLVHQRIPMGFVPQKGYMKRLVQAHKLHHAVQTREGAVSFGFLWAEDVAKVKRQLDENRQTGR